MEGPGGAGERLQGPGRGDRRRAGWAFLAEHAGWLRWNLSEESRNERSRSTSPAGSSSAWPPTPTPTTSSRGVSGFTWSYPGEPDLDRTVRFQPEGAFASVACEPEIGIGVYVDEVRVDGVVSQEHHAGRGAVHLADAAQGSRARHRRRSGLLEPIVLFRLRFLERRPWFGRSYADRYDYLVTELRGKGIDFSMTRPEADIARVTGIADLGAVWAERERRLRSRSSRTRRTRPWRRGLPLPHRLHESTTTS